MSFPLMLLAGVFIFITVVAFAFTVRGLLGINFSTVRLLIAGAITFACFSPIMNAIVDADEFVDNGAFPGLWFFFLGISLALLCGMAVLVIAEALVPSNTLPGPLYVYNATRRYIRRNARYRQIAAILIRRGLWAYLGGGRRSELKTTEGRAALARSVRLALGEGGVTFVKFGQILSTRRDLLPPEFIDELATLQHRADPVPWAEIDGILQRTYGNRFTDVFSRFDQEPLAAASIAQVHTARLVTGEEVVVKIRRPGIDSQVERDLDIVERLAATLDRSTGWGHRIGIVSLADGFATALREELDFRVEARNMATVAAAAKRRGDDTGLHIPVSWPDFGSAQVLVMERITGIPLGIAYTQLSARGLDGTELATSLLESLLRQIVIDGTFHADPHPGNVLLMENGKLTLLDFGSVGRIDRLLQGAIVRLMLAFDHGDPISATDALLGMVNRPDDLDDARLERSIGQFMARFLTPGAPADVQMFTDLFRILSQYGLTVPPEVAAVFRAIATMDGTLSLIAPGFDIIDGARDFAGGYLGEQVRPAALVRNLTDELTALLPMIRRMPRRLDRIAAALEDGRLNVNVRTLADRRDRSTVGGMLHEAMLTVLACTAGLMGVILLGQDGGPQVTGQVSMFQFIGYALLVGALILAMRVLVQIFRPDNRRERV